MQDAITACTSAGITCSEFTPPEADLSARLWGDLLFTETEIFVGDAIREFGSRDMISLVENYHKTYDLLDLKQFLSALGERRRIQRKWSQMFDEIDLLLMPTSMIAPFENDLDFKKPSEVPNLLDAQKPLHSINLLGLPSAAFPTGLSSGVPVGVQLVGPMHDDWFVLDIAERIERELGTIWQNLKLPN
jgi:amidase